MKLMLFLLLSNLILTTSAQVRFTRNLDPLIKKEYKKIRSLGSDTIVIYEQYCVGCEIRYTLKDGSDGKPKPCVYEGFERGRIYWKLNNKYYSKEIGCVGDADINVLEANGEIFEYFFSNLNHFKSIEKYKFSGRFYPPVPVHTSYEKLSVYTPDTTHQVYLAEQQKKDANWKTYEWIPPSIKIMEIAEKPFLHRN